MRAHKKKNWTSCSSFIGDNRPARRSPLSFPSSCWALTLPATCFLLYSFLPARHRGNNAPVVVYEDIVVQRLLISPSGCFCQQGTHRCPDLTRGIYGLHSHAACQQSCKFLFLTLIFKSQPQYYYSYSTWRHGIFIYLPRVAKHSSAIPLENMNYMFNCANPWVPTMMAALLRSGGEFFTVSSGCSVKSEAEGELVVKDVIFTRLCKQGEMQKELEEQISK